MGFQRISRDLLWEHKWRRTIWAYGYYILVIICYYHMVFIYIYTHVYSIYIYNYIYWFLSYRVHIQLSVPASSAWVLEITRHGIEHGLVGGFSPYPEKWWRIVSWDDVWHSQLNGKKHVPKHQPDGFLIRGYSSNSHFTWYVLMVPSQLNSPLGFIHPGLILIIFWTTWNTILQQIHHQLLSAVSRVSPSAMLSCLKDARHFSTKANVDFLKGLFCAKISINCNAASTFSEKKQLKVL